MNNWVEQGEKVLQCKLGIDWAEFFWQEALQVADKQRGDGSMADTLVTIFDTAYHNEETQTAHKYEQQLRADYATSGAVEYIEAQYAYKANPAQTSKVLGFLRKARSNASKTGESGVLESVDAFEQFIKQPPRLRNNLQEMFAELFGDLDKGELDAFRQLF